MAKITKSIIINAPVDKVFNYVSNPKNMLEWHPNITKIRNVTGKGENLQWAWDYKMMGINFTGKAQVVALDQVIKPVCPALKFNYMVDFLLNISCHFHPPFLTKQRVFW